VHLSRQVHESRRLEQQGYDIVSVDQGMALCPSLGLVVTYDLGRLFVWELPNSGTGSTLRQLHRRGEASCNGLTFVRIVKLGDDTSPCCLAFTPPSHCTQSGPLLLVSAFHVGAVYVVDVVRGAHVGYLAERWSIQGPRGVAASGAAPLAAVSAWWSGLVHLYQGYGLVWEPVRVVGAGFDGPGAGNGRLDKPFGVRFSRDGSSICVADRGNNRVCMFRVGDGGFVRHMATGLSRPNDVEEVEGGWLVACRGSNLVEFVPDGGIGGIGGQNSFLGGASGRGFRAPTALAVVPGLGLVVCDEECVQVFVSPDAIAMEGMSVVRVGWMVGVARGMLHRRHLQLRGQAPSSLPFVLFSS
jgi:hypothetical protein